jgi:polyhydroxyalkanoate synthase
MARDGDERLASLTLLAAQVDFTEPGELGLFIDESQLNFLDNVMAGKGYLDGTQMEGAFALLNAKDMVWSRMVQNYLMGKGRRVTSDLAAWNADATRMPYRQQSEYLRSLYLDNDLAQGRYRTCPCSCSVPGATRSRPGCRSTSCTCWPTLTSRSA